MVKVYSWNDQTAKCEFIKDESGQVSLSITSIVRLTYTRVSHMCYCEWEYQIGAKEKDLII
jgi:hypothetical protein